MAQTNEATPNEVIFTAKSMHVEEHDGELQNAALMINTHDLDFIVDGQEIDEFEFRCYSHDLVKLANSILKKFGTQP